MVTVYGPAPAVTNEADTTPPLIVQLFGVVSPELVIVHVVASDAKPIPETDIVLVGRLMGLFTVTNGLTVKLAEPESTTVPLAGQLTVTVYAALAMPLGTFPTLKVP